MEVELIVVTGEWKGWNLKFVVDRVTDIMSPWMNG